MTIENGTTIVLAYVLVSMGVIIAFLLAVFVIGCALSRDYCAFLSDKRLSIGIALPRS